MLKEITNNVTRWDTYIFQRIFGWGDRRFLTRYFRILSWSANGYLYPLVAMYVLLTFETSITKPFLLSAAVAFPIKGILYHLIKQTLKRDRPYQKIDDITFRVRPPDRFSFPSGHTASAFLVMTLLSSFFPIPILHFTTFIWASMVGVARVYLGVHYPTDVLAGSMLGILSAEFAMLIVQ